MSDLSRRLFQSLAFVLLAAPAVAVAQQDVKPPETFNATAQVSGQAAGASATVVIHLDAYSDDRNVRAMQDALQGGGYPKFLELLRKAPQVGHIEMNARKVPVRFARQVPTAKGRTITVVADAPLFFIGGGDVNAPPRAGYELTIAQLQVDSVGLGTGQLAPASRVRPGGPTGVEVDEYGEKPVVLASVRKAYR
jgi:hypothetical protein